MFTPALTPNQIYIQPSITPTINYYQEDLYAQCRGLEYFKKIKLENDRSLELNANFNKEYQKTLAYIERDKKMLGLDYFKCP
jgi:phage repressor protein C with HTH and peptisase S24 domain